MATRHHPPPKNTPPADGVRRLSARGLSWLKLFEQGPAGGFAAVPYLDDAGHWTVGWGHKVRPDERFDSPLTERAAHALLLRDVRDAEVFVSALDIHLGDHEFDALVLFVFNLGVGALERSTLLKVLRRAERVRDDIIKQWLRWVYLRAPSGKMRQADGLKRRRMVEVLLFLGATDPTIIAVDTGLQAVARAGSIGPQHIQAQLSEVFA